jgi:hypothetical protein
MLRSYNNFNTINCFLAFCFSIYACLKIYEALKAS